MLTNQKILIGITGAIAAYKSIEFVRLLREAGNEVRVVMTKTATSFVTPTTLQAISGHPVAFDLFDSDSESAMPHIDLARWCDYLIVAPATADFIARLASGQANDLLTTICLATQAPIAVAPSMNRQMWVNSFTQDNIQRLKKHGIQIIEPAVGTQACGEYGPGRLQEPSELFNFIQQRWMPKKMQGIRVLITAGPTQEAIDPVRVLTNRSSGKMGYALAEAAYAAGAKVTVISGPTVLSLSSGVTHIPVMSAGEMYDAVMENVKDVDVLIGAAAVSDYRIENPSAHKLKKSGEPLTLTLIPNPDILQSVAALPEKPFVVGFALETENILENAKTKLHRKNLDMIIANTVSGLDSDATEVVLIQREGNLQQLAKAPKSALAQQLIEMIRENYLKNNRSLASSVIPAKAGIQN